MSVVGKCPMLLECQQCGLLHRTEWNVRLFKYRLVTNDGVFEEVLDCTVVSSNVVSRGLLSQSK